MASRSLGTLTLDLIARIGGFQQGMDQAARSAQRSMSQVERQAQQTSHSVMSAFKGIAGAAAAYLSAQQVVEYSQTWIGVQNRIKQVSETYDQFAKQSQAVFQIAQNSQSGLDATAELYQRIAASSGQLGTTQEKVAQVTQNISKAMSASGVSAEAAQGALVQLGQAFASGVLRGQELNSVLEQAPGLAQAIADGLGVSRESLRSLGEQGKLTSKEVFQAILSQTQAIDDAFARSQTTLSAGWTVIQNSATKIVGSLDEAYGITKSAAQAMLDLSSAADSTSIKDLVNVLETGLYVALGRTVGGIASYILASRAKRAADAEQAFASSVAAAGELRRAEAAQAAASSDLTAARSAVSAAAAKVAADRQVIAVEISRLQTVQNAIAAEKVLETQRLQAQITDAGRQQSVARMAELRLTEVAITKQLTAAEAQLSAVTVAGSAEMSAALAQRTAATEVLATANGHLTSTQLAANAATASAMATFLPATTALGAAIASLRTAGSALLRMAAGWPGLIITMGVLAYSFIDFGDKAEEGAGKAANAFEDASTRIRQASRSMLPENLGAQSYDQLQERLKGLQAELKETEQLQERFQKGVDNKSDVPFESSLDASKEKADALRLAIQSVHKELNSSRLASDKEGNTYLKNLEKQAVVAGKLTEVEKLRAQIAAGAIKFSPDDEKKALSAAAAIDKANSALKESKANDKDNKALSKRFEEAEEGYQRQIELINTEIDKRKSATEVEKLAFEISSGKYEALDSKQRKRLEGLAAELDARKKLKQANEDDKVVKEFKASVDRQQTLDQRELDAPLLNAWDTDEVKQRYLDRLAIEQDFQDQLEDLRLRHEVKDISDSVYERETDILNEALEQRLEMQEKYYRNVDKLQQSGTAGFISGFATQAEVAMDLYSNMQSVGADTFQNLTDTLSQWAKTGELDVKGFASTFIQSMGNALLSYAAAQVAMAALSAFTAMIGVPFVGPAIAPGAAIAAAGAAGVLMTAVGSSLDGQAHAGMDYIPREGTWLLDGGERVLSPNQNRDLTRFLSDDSRHSGGLPPGGVQDRSLKIINNGPPVRAREGMSEGEMAVILEAAEERIANGFARGTGRASRAAAAAFALRRDPK